MMEAKKSMENVHCADTTSTISKLRAYKKLSDNPLNHRRLLKDKAVLLFIATLLDNKSEKRIEILDICLDILQLFVADCRNHRTIINTFGLFESLNALSISLSSDPSFDVILTKTNMILDILQSATMRNPARDKKIGENTKTYFMYNVYLPDLSPESKKQYEDILLATQGVVSFVMDLERKTCVVRIYSMITIQSVLRNIKNAAETTPLIIVKNKSGDKELVDACEESARSHFQLECEEAKSGMDGTIAYFSHKYGQTKESVKSLIDTWNAYFYW